MSWEDDIDVYTRGIFCDMVDMGASDTGVTIIEIAEYTGEVEDQLVRSLQQMMECAIPIIQQTGTKYKVKKHAVNMAKTWAAIKSSTQ